MFVPAGASSGDGRSPLGIASPVVLGPGPQLIQLGSVKQIASIGGLPLAGQVWAVSIQGADPPILLNGIPVPGSSFRHVFAILEWSIGLSRQRIEVDLPADGLSLGLAFDALSVSVSNVPPAPLINDRDVRYQVSVSSSFGARVAAVARRTIPIVGPAPPAKGFARIPVRAGRVQFMLTADLVPPPATAAVSLQIQDANGTPLGAVSLDNATQPTRTIDLPCGAATVSALVITGAVAVALQGVYEINP